MKCPICKQGTTKPGMTCVTLGRAETTVVIKSVPAQICENCGEAYVAESVSERIVQLAQEASRRGIEAEIRTYAEAV